MATTKLTKFWTAEFEDGTVLRQPEDDRYSKHDDSVEWNPSSFQDILDKTSKIVSFRLHDITVDMKNGVFYTQTTYPISLESEPLTDRKLIYYREMERQNIGGEWQDPQIKRYAVGYEGKNSKGKVEKKVIYIDG